MSRRGLFFGMLCCAVACSASCSSMSTPEATALPPILVSTAQVCNTIGPEGGSVTHPAGGKLVVPVSALSAPVSLCLTGIAPPPDATLGGAAVGQGFDASPSGQTFRKPVDLYLPFDATRLSSSASTSSIQVRMAPQGTTDFVSLASSADIATGLVHTQTVHFTQFIPAVDPNPVFITTAPALPSGTVGVAYAQSFQATGGTAPYAWSVSPVSAAPPGLAFGGASLAGVPILPDNYAFFVVASDAASHAVQKAFAFTVSAAVNAVPTLAQVAPSALPQGSATSSVVLTGTGFAPTAQALWDGTPIATTFSSATSLAAAIPAASLVNAGTHAITVSNPAPGGGTSGAVTFTVSPVAQNPVPTIASVSPDALPVSTIDTAISVIGSGFLASSAVAIGAQGIATLYVSPTELSATIPASYVSVPGTLQIDVFNPAPGGGFSASSIPVVVGAVNPVPTVAAIAPSSAMAGSGAFTLTASGTGFVSGGQLFFGSTALATTVADATSASATVAAALVAQVGTAQVTFVNPTPGGGASAASTFTITAPGGVDAGSCPGASGCYSLITPIPTTSITSPFVLNTTTVFWSDNTHTIWSCPKTGCASPVALITNQGSTTPQLSFPNNLVANDQYLFWELPYVSSAFVHTIARCALSDCPGTKTIVVSYHGTSPDVPIALDATNLYFANGSSAGVSTPTYDSIYSTPLGGGPQTQVVSGGTRIDQLTMTTSGLFWSDDGAVKGPGFSAPCVSPTCDPVQSVSPLAFVGGGQVFFTQSLASASSVMTCPVGGCSGSATTLVSGMLTGIDSAYFYFLAACVNSTGGSTRCTRRCPFAGCPAQPEEVPSAVMDGSYFYAFAGGSAGGTTGVYGLYRIAR